MSQAIEARAASDERRSPLSVTVLPEGVALIVFDLPGSSTNSLRAEFGDTFEAVLEQIENDPDVRAAVLISGKADSFVVGADVDMLRAVKTAADGEAISRRGQLAMAKLSCASKPVVAAIHGQALGGGFELALACHGRVLSNSPKTVLGLPEVQLGLLPGMSGLQRLADLAGLAIALDHGLTGKNMRPTKARKLGVADEVVPLPILRQVAVELALRLAEGKQTANRSAPRMSASERLGRFALEKNSVGRALLFSQARKKLRAKTGGHYPAPERIIDVIECFAKEGMPSSQRLEARHFGELAMSKVSAELMGIFFATRALKKDSGAADPKTRARDLNSIAVLGAGLMGAGIAYISIDKGLQVRLKDRDAASLGRGLGYVANLLGKRRKRRQLSAGDEAARMARLSTTVDCSGMKHVDLVVEAVFEDLSLKQEVLREVEAAARSGVIFASNTSSIPIARIAEASRAPENVVGMHYFSPVHKMPLLEVIRTEKSSDVAVATAVALGKRQGKTVIVVSDGVGFYTTRILAPYLNEACYLLSEGVAVEIIDRTMTSWGWPVGPLALMDEVGIDVGAHVGKIMLEAFGERMAPPPSMVRLAEGERKGRKNGSGFYRYDAASKKKGKSRPVDHTIYEALGLPMPAGTPPVPSDEISERLNLQFINEALHCFGEGILRSPADGDIGAVFGLGFPPFLGGPFRAVDALGADSVRTKLDTYAERFGARFAPAPVLVEMAKTHKRFYA